MKQTYVAFLRGINVGGHHKIPVAVLREEMRKLDLGNVQTLLNSGNIVFDAIPVEIETLEKKISAHLETVFEFAIPTIIRKSETIIGLLEEDPFRDVQLTKDIRLYVSFLKKKIEIDLELPWTSEEGAYKIIAMKDNTILSVLDLSATKTPYAMNTLERYFGTDITTRNWNTIKRLEKKLIARC